MSVRRAQAQAALVRLGIPVVTGAHPVEVLQAAVDSASAMHQALDRLVRETASLDDADSRALAAQLELHGAAIDRAAKVAESAFRVNLAGRTAMLDAEVGAVITRVMEHAITTAGVPADSANELRRSLAVELRRHARLDPVDVTPALPTREE